MGQAETYNRGQDRELPLSWSCFYLRRCDMFGFGKGKEYDVRLTEKQMQELTKNMTRQERKDFNKRQKQAQADREWDALMMTELFMDD